MNKITYLCLLMFSICLIDVSPINASNSNTTEYYSQMQRVRLDFTMPNGYIRHLLLGFTPDNAASEGIDYGYDTPTYDNFSDDLNWMIEGQRYVIQGVGEYIETNQYPLGMFLNNGGNIEIALTSTENFSNPIEVYLFDAVLNTYTLINESSFTGEFEPGEYLDRFYIAFVNPNNNENSDDETILSIDDQTQTIAQIKYLRYNNELKITANNLISRIEVYNLLGKKIISKQNIHAKEIKIKLNSVTSPYGLVRIYTKAGIATKKIILK